MPVASLGLVDQQQPPQTLEFRPSNIKVESGVFSEKGKKKKHALIHVNIAISSTQNADGSEDGKTKCY